MHHDVAKVVVRCNAGFNSPVCCPKNLGGVKKISGFTFTSETVSGGSSAETSSVSLSVTGDPLIAENMKPGDSDDTTLTVTNEGTVDVLYYLSADWSGKNTTASRMATILANRLMITVIADPDDAKVELYAGTLAGLLDQPSNGRALAFAETNGSEDLSIEIELPVDVSNIVQGLSIAVDFVFVAEEQ